MAKVTDLEGVAGVNKVARLFVVTISVINAVCALICGVLFIGWPDGSLMAAGEMLEYIAAFPLAQVFFQDFRWIGIAMLLVLGLPNILASIALLKKHAFQYQIVIIANALMMLWCAFQFVYLFNWLAVGYFSLGTLMIACAIYLSKCEEQVLR